MIEDVVFLVDVDNTVLDNDRFVADLRQRLTADFGEDGAACYWRHYESLRRELGYADYLGALQRLRDDVDADTDGPGPHRLLALSGFMLDYPFAERLYPQAVDVLAALGRIGTTVLLSDGDVVFQPRKLQRSGLWQAVEGRVLICVHKERELDAVEHRFPSRRYVMVDDKERVLAAMKSIWNDRLFSVFPRQGHYALDPANLGRYPAPDLTVERIADLLDPDLRARLARIETKENA